MLRIRLMPCSPSLGIALPSAAAAAAAPVLQAANTPCRSSAFGRAVDICQPLSTTSAYSIDGSVSSAGLGQLFDDTRGTISSSGTFRQDDRCREAVSCRLYVYGKKATMVDIRFAKGNVVKIDASHAAAGQARPQTGCRSAPSDLASVADPMAATSSTPKVSTRSAAAR